MVLKEQRQNSFLGWNVKWNALFFCGPGVYDFISALKIKIIIKFNFHMYIIVIGFFWKIIVICVTYCMNKDLCMKLLKQNLFTPCSIYIARTLKEPHDLKQPLTVNLIWYLWLLWLAPADCNDTGARLCSRVSRLRLRYELRSLGLPSPGVTLISDTGHGQWDHTKCDMGAATCLMRKRRKMLTNKFFVNGNLIRAWRQVSHWAHEPGVAAVYYRSPVPVFAAHH